MSISDKYRPRYTCADYMQWEGESNWELIDGMPYAKSSSPLFHQKTCGNLYTTFTNALENKSFKFAVLVALGWIINEKTVVQPDLLVCREISKDKEFLDFTPSLVLEILSSSTINIDRHEKFELYEQEGVKYYLIVDPQFSKIEVYQLTEGKYQPVAITPTQFSFLLEEGCELPVDFTGTWD